MPIADYLAVAWLPVLLSLLTLWARLAFGPGAGATVGKTVGARDERETEAALDRLESAKGLLAATTLMVLFLFTDVNREMAALVGAGVLLVLGSALSNLVSNVPAVMLLLPHLPAGDASGVLLALASTFAGNLLLVGSIANLIVVGLAERAGVVIDWKQHARIGIPVTLLSLAQLWFCWQVLGIQPPPKVSS